VAIRVKLTKVKKRLQSFIYRYLEQNLNKMQKAVNCELIFKNGINKTDEWCLKGKII
jgi:hypothetical protein